MWARPAGPGLWSKAARTALRPGNRAKEATGEGGGWEGHFPPEAGRGDNCPAALCYCGGMPPLELGASWDGGEAANSVPASPPALSADAVHLCPARSSPPNPEHLPRLPCQQICGSEGPGRWLQGERHTCSAPTSGRAGGFLQEKEEMKLPPHSRPPAARHPRDTGNAPGGPDILPKGSSAYKTSGQLHSHPLLL